MQHNLPHRQNMRDKNTPRTSFALLQWMQCSPPTLLYSGASHTHKLIITNSISKCYGHYTAHLQFFSQLPYIIEGTIARIKHQKCNKIVTSWNCPAMASHQKMAEKQNGLYCEIQKMITVVSNHKTTTDSLECYQNKYITILSVQILDSIKPSSLHHHQLLQTLRVGSMNVQLKLLKRICT